MLTLSQAKAMLVLLDCQGYTTTHNQANKLGLSGYREMEALSAKLVGFTEELRMPTPELA